MKERKPKGIKMKRVIMFVILATISCAKTPLDRVKKEVVTAIKEHMSEPKSYQGVDWGSLDSAFVYAKPVDVIINTGGVQVFQDSDQGKWYKLHPEQIEKIEGNEIIRGSSDQWYYLNYTSIDLRKEQRRTIQQLGDSLKRQYSVYNDLESRELAKRYLQKYPKEISTVDTSSLNKKGLMVFNGYYIDHTFRIKNNDKKSSKQLVKYRFFIDRRWKYQYFEKRDIKTIDNT